MGQFNSLRKLTAKGKALIDDIRVLTYLLRTDAPIEIFTQAILCRITKPTPTITYAEENNTYLQELSELKKTNDWFIPNIPFWLWLFDEYSFLKQDNLQLLEIGSWEGLSSYFMLTALPTATLLCVDTWEGADEHKSGIAANKAILSEIEKAFRDNTARFKSRITLFKGRSLDFFANNSAAGQFDFIYVDGSHYCDDVLIDALHSFELLKVGGFIVFDDYLWRLYRKIENNPACAINAFLRLKRGEYKIIRVYFQLIIKKTTKNNREIDKDYNP